MGRGGRESSSGPSKRCPERPQRGRIHGRAADPGGNPHWKWKHDDIQLEERLIKGPPGHQATHTTSRCTLSQSLSQSVLSTWAGTSIVRIRGSRLVSLLCWCDTCPL